MRAGTIGCLLMVGSCTSLTQESSSTTTVTTAVKPNVPPNLPFPEGFCLLSPRFRLGGIDYRVETDDDVVAADQVGELVTDSLILPVAVTNCEPSVVLKDGEGELPPGTKVYEIIDVDPTQALTAALPGGPFLRFLATTT